MSKRYYRADMAKSTQGQAAYNWREMSPREAALILVRDGHANYLVEGYTISPGGTIERHTWAEAVQGRAIDLHYKDLELTYVPGRVIPADELALAIAIELILRLGSQELDKDDGRVEMSEALRLAARLADQRRPTEDDGDNDEVLPSSSAYLAQGRASLRSS